MDIFVVLRIAALGAFFIKNGKKYSENRKKEISY